MDITELGKHFVNTNVCLVLQTGQKIFCHCVDFNADGDIIIKYAQEFGVDANGQTIMVAYHPYMDPEGEAVIDRSFIKGHVPLHGQFLDAWLAKTKQTPPAPTILQKQPQKIIVP